MNQIGAVSQGFASQIAGEFEAFRRQSVANSVPSRSSMSARSKRIPTENLRGGLVENLTEISVAFAQDEITF